jgi:hypothetical protein
MLSSITVSGRSIGDSRSRANGTGPTRRVQRGHDQAGIHASIDIRSLITCIIIIAIYRHNIAIFAAQEVCGQAGVNGRRMKLNRNSIITTRWIIAIESINSDIKDKAIEQNYVLD